MRDDRLDLSRTLGISLSGFAVVVLLFVKYDISDLLRLDKSWPRFSQPLAFSKETCTTILKEEKKE